jgi:hypothetical protein
MSKRSKTSSEKKLPLLERLIRYAKELHLAARRAHQKVRQHNNYENWAYVSTLEYQYRARRKALQSAEWVIRKEIRELRKEEESQ